MSEQDQERERNEVKSLLNEWSVSQYPSEMRNALRKLAKAAGYDTRIGDYVLDLTVQKKPVSILGIHELAKKMIEAGFLGQGMNDEENARDFIGMAAVNPHVEDELPLRGFAFWKAAKFQFNRWQARNRFNKS